MEKQVEFRDMQELQAADLNNVQGFAADSMQHIVADGISADQKYTGFATSQDTVSSVNVAPGRLYHLGMVYVSEVITPLNLFSFLPSVSQKIVAVVVTGVTVDTDIEQRDFLQNVDTQTTEPRAVAMQSLRQAQIAVIAGAESPAPQAPAIPSTSLCVALVTMATTGISAIVMQVRNQLPQAQNLDGRVGSLESWQAQTDPRISTITSDIARQAALLDSMSPISVVRRIAADVAQLKSIAQLPDTYSDWGGDHFIDESHSDKTYGGYAAEIAEGLRFPPGTSARGALMLLNSIDPSVINLSGFLLPIYSDVVRLTNLAGYAGPQYLASYQFQTTQHIIRGYRRSRLRFGSRWNPSSSQTYMTSYDVPYATQVAVFARAGETFTFLDPADFLGFGDEANWYRFVRVSKVWTDVYTRYYWDLNYVVRTITGSQLSQVFLNAQDGWLTKIGLYFPAVATTGDVSVSIVDASTGKPDMNTVLAQVTVPVGSILAYPTETTITLPPTFLSGGQRYAIVVQSGGAHAVATVAGTSVTNGTLYHFLDGAFQPVNGSNSLMFTMRFAQFSASSTVVNLQPLSLSGGIGDVNVVYPDVTPASCDLRFEAQVAGVWYPLTRDAANQNVFATGPALVPVRAVFTGTLDVQPGFHLTQSECEVSSPATAFLHASVTRTVASPTTSVTVRLLCENWDGAKHTVACQLIVSGSPVSPSVTSTEPADTGVWKVFHFAISSSSTYQIVVTGSTNTPGNVFHAAERVDIAF